MSIQGRQIIIRIIVVWILCCVDLIAFNSFSPRLNGTDWRVPCSKWAVFGLHNICSKLVVSSTPTRVLRKLWKITVQIKNLMPLPLLKALITRDKGKKTLFETRKTKERKPSGSNFVSFCNLAYFFLPPFSRPRSYDRSGKTLARQDKIGSRQRATL